MKLFKKDILTSMGGTVENVCCPSCNFFLMPGYPRWWKRCPQCGEKCVVKLGKFRYTCTITGILRAKVGMVVDFIVKDEGKVK